MKKLEVEHFHSIVGYENYKISKLGEVVGTRGELMRLKIDKYGYQVIGLWKGTKKYHTTVHRLVAAQFIPNPDNKPQINHIDGDKRNNFYKNLEWVTAKENIVHSWKIGSAKKRFGSDNKKSLKVISISNDGTKKEWHGIKALCRDTGMDRRSIQKCLKGKIKTAYGYKWEYA